MCLNSATISVLVNRSSTKEFKRKRCLRQGDPLAPFLFLITVEGLAGLVRKASSFGVLEGVRVGGKGVVINLLQFADDKVFFHQLKYQCILAIKSILRSFEIVSALRMNFHKSHVGVIGVTEVDLNIFLDCLNGVPF